MKKQRLVNLKPFEFSPTRAREWKRVLNEFKDDISDVQTPLIKNDELEDLVTFVGYPVLSICLHAPFFLYYLSTGADEYPHISWEAMLNAIVGHRSTELFAKVRGLDFETPMERTHPRWHLLDTYLVKDQTQLPRMFGTRPTGGFEFHNTTAIIQAGPPKKHWAMPQDPRAAAVTCKITYTVGAGLTHVPGYTQGDVRTEDQIDIGDSTLLPGYQWPNQARWPSDDPREDGYEKPCLCCDTKRGPVRKTQSRRTYPAACNCTLDKYRKKRFDDKDMKGDVEPVLFELVTSYRMGTGVKALQNIFTDEILGIYEGEMYPRSKLDEAARNALFGTNVNDDTCQPDRYGGAAGNAYIMNAYMSKRHPKHEPQPKKRKASSDDTIVTERDVELLPLDANEWKTYSIDSAIRGNWTRYINHSCNPNTRYETVQIGQKSLMVVQAMRDISFGEILTVDYNESYFPHMPYRCKCGTEYCYQWNNADPFGLKKQTLAMAMQKKSGGPRWVRDKADPDHGKFPFPVPQGSAGAPGREGRQDRLRWIDVMRKKMGLAKTNDHGQEIVPKPGPRTAAKGGKKTATNAAPLNAAGGKMSATGAGVARTAAKRGRKRQ
ncbi:uncharacterized protein AB675_235 [Cyphellophora attinorum]|uniref:SET domain-containing protein n=1 Tax=Cyphellophora attinorum TaxID=1664694 RepID=A0A0N1HQG7_9EURO|nr:uncharacterized protein AB675_235 [Phialophora attinorum]KPI37745.1 hypothetical protein AB675_235 [Phialophora attinorum]